VSEVEKEWIQNEREEKYSGRDLPEAITCLIFVFNLQFIVHKSRSDKIVETNSQTSTVFLSRDLSVLLAEKIK